MRPRVWQFVADRSTLSRAAQAVLTSRKKFTSSSFAEHDNASYVKYTDVAPTFSSASTSSVIKRGRTRRASTTRFPMAADVTVLLIEDNEPTQLLLHHTLRARYTVLTASCWAQAHQIRQRSTVDAIVVDVNLASSDGAGLKALCAEAGTTPLMLVANTSAEPNRPQDGRDALLLALATRAV